MIWSACVTFSRDLCDYRAPADANGVAISLNSLASRLPLSDSGRSRDTCYSESPQLMVQCGGFVLSHKIDHLCQV